MGNLTDYMSSPVVTILPTKTVLDAAKLIVKYQIESLVVSWGEEAVGILTEKDIVRRVVKAAMERGYTNIYVAVHPERKAAVKTYKKVGFK